MTIRYVGKGGNDGNSGLTWALRKLTLNGAEDTPVVAGDVVYVGPGAYRELLTVDVDGNAGNEIEYIADVTGEHTDGVGGIVRVTGSDNDTTNARANCINIGSHDYRTFRGFHFDMGSSHLVIAAGTNTNNTFEDCTFQSTDTGGGIYTTESSDWIVRRCLFTAIDVFQNGVRFDSVPGIANSGNLIENCMFWGYYGHGVRSLEVGGITIRNCLFGGLYYAVRVATLPGGYTAVTVNNSLVVNCQQGFGAGVLGEIVENYNAVWVCQTARTNVNVGAQSNIYPPLYAMPILHSGVSQISGFKFPWWWGELSEWSQLQAITGSNEPTEELRGIARPVTASKNSWGPFQFFDAERETGTKRTGSASIVLHDAGRHQIWVPVSNVSTTISVYVYREANYAGNNPQMIIKQPGQADDVTTDAAAASQWNQLTTTLTPAADPPWVVVELVSRNTAVALAYEVFFDDLEVS